MLDFCKYLFFSTLLVATIFISCAIEKTNHGINISKKRNEKITPEGYSILKKGKFRLKDKFQLTDTLILSPSKIYETFCYDIEWFKFYKNGRVLNCLINQDSNHISAKPYYRCGYYSLNNNEIKIEMSEMATFAFGDSYDILIIKGKVIGDTIKFDKDQWGGSGRNIGYYGGRKDEKGQNCFYIKKANRFFDTKEPSW